MESWRRWRAARPPCRETERMTGFTFAGDTQKWSLLGVVETARDLNSFFQRSVVPPAPSYCVSRSAGGYNSMQGRAFLDPPDPFEDVHQIDARCEQRRRAAPTASTAATPLMRTAVLPRELPALAPKPGDPPSRSFPFAASHSRADMHVCSAGRSISPLSIASRSSGIDTSVR